MERRKVEILCVQEAKWKGSKARKMGGDHKLFYHGKDGKRNGVGITIAERFTNSVLEVRRVSDAMMCMKMEIEGVMYNIISAYASQVGCVTTKKDEF